VLSATRSWSERNSFPPTRSTSAGKHSRLRVQCTRHGGRPRARCPEGRESRCCGLPRAPRAPRIARAARTTTKPIARGPRSSPQGCEVPKTAEKELIEPSSSLKRH
jgi:hypothetical protein